MDGDEFCPVRECAFHLDLADHLGHTFHDVICSQNACAQAHDLRDGFAVPNLFQQVRCDQSHSFGIIELQPPAFSPARHFTCCEDHELSASRGVKCTENLFSVEKP